MLTDDIDEVKKVPKSSRLVSFFCPDDTPLLYDVGNFDIILFMSGIDKFVAVGHITNDVLPRDHLGGGVSYSAVAARRLGKDAHIITKCPPDHPYIADLKHMGVSVHVLHSHHDKITSFRNFELNGKREQQVTERQDPISIEDFDAFPKDILNDAAILVAPVIGEVDMQLYPVLARSRLLAVTPQGYFRDIDSEGNVTRKKWTGFEEYLKYADVIVLSNEDISINSEIPDQKLLHAMVRVCRLVALTQGENGLTVYENNRGQIKSLHTGAFSLDETEKVKMDLIGAGDTSAAALITEIARGVKLKAASVSAAFFAALKIMGISGIGIDSIPTREQGIEFKNANLQRVRQFLDRENTSEITLFEA